MRFPKYFPIVFMLIVCIGDNGYASHKLEKTPDFSTKSFSLYALSRGKGVPKTAQEVLKETQELLNKAKQQGKVFKLTKTRIGLEGETRLCVEFPDEETTRDFFEQVSQIIEQVGQTMGKVELVNLVVEPCPNR